MLTQYPSQDIIFKVMTPALDDTGLLVLEETEIDTPNIPPLNFTFKSLRTFFFF